MSRVASRHLPDTERGEHWSARAACSGMDLGLFFPDQGEKSTAARRVCAACPVAAQCREFAGRFSSYGVFGGELWAAGNILVTERPVGTGGQLTRTYPQKVRERGLALYRQLRPAAETDTQACEQVAEQLGIRSRGTVMYWVRDAENPDGPQLGARERKLAQRRADAVAMLRRIRPQYPSDESACAAVAREFGTVAGTVRQWERRAAAAARVQLGEAA